MTFAMRVSIPALFLARVRLFARIVVLTPRDNGAFATFVVGGHPVGFATPMLELKQAFRAPMRSATAIC